MNGTHDNDRRLAAIECDDAELFWDNHYRTKSANVDRVNPILVETAAPLQIGAAADLGCGAGGDTIWLAQRGWHVTAVDIAVAALEQVRQRARALGLECMVATEHHDLTRTFPSSEFDLISAQYLHSPFQLTRDTVLRTAAHALRPGGFLLIVDHGSTAPWSWNQRPDVHHPTPTEIARGLNLDPGRWSVVRADQPTRIATGPAGESAVVTDTVLVLRRTAS